MNALKTILPAGLSVALLAFALSACSDPGTGNTPADDETLSGGATTITGATSGSFTFPAPNLESAELDLHLKGDKAFEALFVSGGPINGGLGPIYNNTSCRGCHIQDGRGTPPGPNQQMASMLIRVSLPGQDEHGGPNPVPGFGGQIQNRALHGIMPEANIGITYVPITGKFADDSAYTLQKPIYTPLTTYLPLPAGVLMSPRVAPIVFGLGLLEAIPEATIRGFADENDRNGDGIKGHPNMVYDVATKTMAIGRFGLKANMPNLLQQTAGAYNQDMGITSYLFPNESSVGQAQYPGPSTKTDIDSATLQAAAFYTQTLGVPARRNVNDPLVREGQQIFSDAKCASCHIPTMRTGPHPIAALANQLIHPYTDLLLHDLGDDLSDNRSDYLATGNEWRTAPLWGIGLTSIASGHTNFLHDGRAHNVTEAILWHGGEAKGAREYFKNLSSDKRTALLAFIQSL